jgi:hypothetical protein
MKLTTKSQRMSSAERSELAKLVRLRSRVARNEVMASIGTKLAHFEAQLAATYDKYDEHWAELSKEADAKVKQLDAELAKRCRELGIPDRFRPELDVRWYRRGENATKERRAELIRVAKSELESQALRAKSLIERKEVELIGKIVEEGMDSENAKAFLEAMPTVDQLMPELTLSKIEKAVGQLPYEA